mmetsp:Transcript_21972/g.57850  ORF Transcript_21972/g.57850 Transcript_21972/m.57850 type:complete len:226 (-) Transcript_21972:316-993(-)
MKARTRRALSSRVARKAERPTALRESSRKATSEPTTIGTTGRDACRPIITSWVRSPHSAMKTTEKVLARSTAFCIRTDRGCATSESPSCRRPPPRALATLTPPPHHSITSLRRNMSALTSEHQQRDPAPSASSAPRAHRQQPSTHHARAPPSDAAAGGPDVFSFPSAAFESASIASASSRPSCSRSARGSVSYASHVYMSAKTSSTPAVINSSVDCERPGICEAP